MRSPEPAMSQIVCTLCLAAICLAPISAAVADKPGTDHREGLRVNRPTTVAIVAEHVITAAGQESGPRTILIRDGRIEDVTTRTTVPAGYRIVRVPPSCHVYPGLIDAFTQQSVDTSRLDNSATYWNDQIHPQISVADQLRPDDPLSRTLRDQGITARLVAPSGGIIKGTSAIALTSGTSAKQVLVVKDVAQHLRLTVPRSRSDRESYPNSPMGAVALARQTLYDARWHASATERSKHNPSLRAPDRNTALDALAPALDGHMPVIIDGSNELFSLRADRFAREFGLQLVLRGSGNEYRRIDAIRSTGRTVILPVSFPGPPNVATAESSINVSLETLLHWDFAPENPGRLDAAGIPIALCSYNATGKGEFLAGIRRSVRRGLSPTAALRALTETPARLFNVSDQLGSITASRIANLVITTGDLFDENTQVIETWIAGERFEITQRPIHDVTGKWTLTPTGANNPPLGWELTVDRAAPTARKPSPPLSATISAPSAEASDESPNPKRTVSRIDYRDSILSGTWLDDKSGVIQFTVVLTADDAQTAVGQVVHPDGTRQDVHATRTAASPSTEIGTARNKTGSEASAVAGHEKSRRDQPADFDVNFPLGSFGRSTRPDAASATVFRNATVWTSAAAGTIRRCSVLIGDGRILAVGPDIELPPNATIIDCRGRHLTPGIIDCHSHMATDGGVNESAQAVTAEVRIGDFIDCDDINIYRQLAGGVTTSNILHGSANPIGGQNQVIKLRWGALDEELKFADAPAGIKFALGENVKQSNWGDKYTTRYPQTRMGVEQIVRDRFVAAREYHEQHRRWDHDKSGLPPRRDLELDAILEILDGKRWIHCHSYRQDEILALLRLLDEFDITIGTFQHILEGYKVADAMRQHGAMGSAFSDWWAYKFEVYDAIPFAGALMHDAGIVVSFNSDDRELGRHLNQEAAKAVKYGGVEPAEALKFVTLNPAKQLRIDQFTGSIEVGKQADLVLWHDSPLSNHARCEQTWIDGRKYFDREQDLAARTEIARMRAALIQKVLASGEKMKPPGEGDDDPASLWPRADLFCHGHDFGRN